jgi:hypothetical protein
MPTTAPFPYHVVSKPARDVREGDLIRHPVTNEVVRVLSDRIWRNTGPELLGYVYTFKVEGDSKLGPNSFDMKPTDYLYVCKAWPKVGDFASLCFPSDSYPLIVTKVSKTAAKIELARLNYRIVSGSFQGGDAVVEYWMDPNVKHGLEARWSTRTRRYQAGGVSVSVGHARYYQAPEV